MPKLLSDIVKFLSQKNKVRRANRAKRREQVVFANALGVLAIMKNESMNLDEWVMHYLKVGAGHIYLIDNGSTDDTVAKAQAWVAKGVVSLIERPQKHRQVAHYENAVEQFGIRSACEWLLIADLDEFWFCPDGKPLTEKLPAFNEVDVIYANWRMFGSSGLVSHPTCIRTTLIHSDPMLGGHINTKYLFRTNAIRSRRAIGIHKLHGACSSRTVSDNVTFNLNHYPIQSLHYFQTVKMSRGDSASSKMDGHRTMDYFNRYDAPCTNENRTLADLVKSGRLGTG